MSPQNSPQRTVPDISYRIMSVIRLNRITQKPPDGRAQHDGKATLELFAFAGDWSRSRRKGSNHSLDFTLLLQPVNQLPPNGLSHVRPRPPEPIKS